MNRMHFFSTRLRDVRAHFGALLAFPVMFLLQSCAEHVTPDPAPNGDTDFSGNYDSGSGEMEFAVESPPGVSMRLVASGIILDANDLLHVNVSIRNDGSESVPGPAGVLVSHFQPFWVTPVNTDCPVPIPADSTEPWPPLPWPLPVPGDSTVTPLPPIPFPGGCFFDHRGTYGDDGMLAAGETSAAVEWIFTGTGGDSFAFHARLVTEPAPQDGVISGVVFEDHNENGQRDLEEPGIAGVGVGLVMPDLVRIQVTDELGRYVFEVQDPGLYTLDLTIPDGARATTPEELQVLIVRRPDGSLSGFLHADFGLVKTAPPEELFIEGVVFVDHNRNGQRDRGDEGYAGAGIGASGLLCLNPGAAIVYTDGLGHYAIPGSSIRCPLPWIVQRLPVPGFIGTTPEQMILEQRPPNSDRFHVDFGIATEDSTHPVNVTIEGFVFADYNHNGVRDSVDTGIAFVELQLMSPCDVFLAARTNADGYYRFDPDVVRICPVTGVMQTMPMFLGHTTPNPVEIVLPTVPGNHLLRIHFGIGLERN